MTLHISARLPHLFAYFLTPLIVVLSVLSLHIAAKTIIVLLAAASRLLEADGSMKGDDAAFFCFFLFFFHAPFFVLASLGCCFCVVFCTLPKFWPSRGITLAIVQLTDAQEESPQGISDK